MPAHPDIFLFYPVIMSVIYIVLLFAAVYGCSLIFLKNKEKKPQLKKAVLISVLFLYLGSLLINHFILPDKFDPVSLIGNLAILFFAAFLGWCLTGGRKGMLFAGIVLFCAFIFLIPQAKFKGFHIGPTELERLKSLPYVAWIPAGEDITKKGVTKYNATLANNGLNVYCQDGGIMAYLMEMSGNILRVWSDGVTLWHYAELQKNGDLLGGAEDGDLVKMDWDSNTEWRRGIRFHHDFDVSPEGNIYALGRADKIISLNNLFVPVLEEYIFVISPTGEVLNKIHLFDIFKDYVPRAAYFKIYGWLLRPDILLEMFISKIKNDFALQATVACPSDILHVNNIGIIKKDIEGVCKEGNFLICARNLNLVGILDIDKKYLVWTWGKGELDMPHNPTLLENGNILIFDNGWNRQYSRVIELDPRAKKIVWEYKSKPPEEFFSLKRGSSQRLPNGNTLIAESDKGRVFEVTSSGEIVWEYYEPEVNEADSTRRAIYRMERITDVEDYEYLKDIKNEAKRR